MTAHALAPVVRDGQTTIAGGLLELLHAERRLVEELLGILQRQREAVAMDQLEMVDQASHAMQRALFTLADARRRRRSIGRMLGRADIQLPEIETALGADMTPEIAAAREQLLAVARVLARDVETNRRILRQALATNDRHLARIMHAPESASYGLSSAKPTSAAAGTLINYRA